MAVTITGPESAGSSDYRHDQTTPATVWTITHNLGRYPSSVSLHSPDLSEEYWGFNVQHLDINSLRVATEISIAGVALLS